MDHVMVHNRLLAAELAAAIRAQPKECFRNSVLALAHYRGGAEARYVEGVLVLWEGTVQTDHGWLEIGDWLVDVTLHDCEVAEYHPLFYYTMDDITELVRKRRTLPYFQGKPETRFQMREFSWNLYCKYYVPSKETTA